MDTERADQNSGTLGQSTEIRKLVTGVTVVPPLPQGVTDE